MYFDISFTTSIDDEFIPEVVDEYLEQYTPAPDNCYLESHIVSYVYRAVMEAVGLDQYCYYEPFIKAVQSKVEKAVIEYLDSM